MYPLMNSVLLTDLYQLTMAYGYWKQGLSEREATFHLFFRKAPFGGQACLVAGTTPAVDYLANLQFSEPELDYLSTLRGADGEALFDADFLSYLRELAWTLDVSVIPEGNIALPNEPLLRITGPLVQCQLVETALLNRINFETLIATKAARICAAAQGEPVLEFGLRRAQGPDGGLSASRAAYIGGCAATSNVLAGMRYGIPVKGTHAHSWVMSFDDELEAFEAYAEAMPNNVVLLVDTYDTLEGVRKAVTVGKRLATRGHNLLGIRLDSGDLAELSIGARKLLDEAGRTDTQIVASNDLDEAAIQQLKQDGAKISIWGIGTKLVTAYDQPALGGVYKLGAIRDADGAWQPRVKLSNDLIKVSNPGALQVARRTDGSGRIVEDILYDIQHGRDDVPTDAKDLLVPAITNGKRVLPDEVLAVTQERAHAAWKTVDHDRPTPVRLDAYVEQQKLDLLKQNGFHA